MSATNAGVVAGDDHRRTDGFEHLEQAHHSPRQDRIQISGRFVRQQNLRAVHNSARNANALALTGGQRARQRSIQVKKLDAGQRGHARAGQFLGSRMPAARSGSATFSNTLRVGIR